MIKIKESVKSRHKISNVQPDWLKRTMTRVDVLGRTSKNAFNEHGIEIVYGDEKADYGVSIQGNPVRGVPKEKCILVKVEPPIYNIYYGWNLNNPDYLKKYMSVMSEYEIDGFEDAIIFDTFPSFHKQYHNKGLYSDDFFDVPKSKLLCMMLRNKKTSMILNGFIPKLKKYNKYSNMPFRVETDKFFCEKLGPKYYHSYGRGWDKRCYQYYVPRVPRFPNTLMRFYFISEYQFNFCPENSRFNGYVSEKPLQAMMCGNIPIYLGAPDVHKYIPEDTYIDYRDYTLDELCDYILNMSNREYKGYKSRIKKFITTEESARFSSYEFAKKLIGCIENS